LHPAAGDYVFWLLITVYVVCGAVPIVLLLRLPRALAAPPDEDAPEFDEHLKALGKRLGRNRRISHLPLNTRPEIEAAIAALDEESDELSRQCDHEHQKKVRVSDPDVARRASREETDSTQTVKPDRRAKDRTPLIAAAFIVPVLLVVLIVLFTMERPTVQSGQAGPRSAIELPPEVRISLPPLPPTEPLPYRVVEQKDYSFATTRRMAYRVVVTTNTLPDEATLRTTAEEIWEKGDRGWSEFTVFLYMPGMNTDEMAYGVAEFSPAGLQEFRVQALALIGTRWRP